MSKGISDAPDTGSGPRDALLAGLAALDFVDWLRLKDMWTNAYVAAPAPAGFDWTNYVLPYPESRRENIYPSASVDNFKGSTPSPVWKFTGGVWEQHDGTLSQIATQPGDPQKATYCSGVYIFADRVSAKVSVSEWTPGADGSRAGVGLKTDAYGTGYNLVFRDGCVQFLDDGREWGVKAPYDWKYYTWYVFKLEYEQATGTLYGKVWPDGQQEPAEWTVTQTGWTWRLPGCAALNGGSGTCTVTFASFLAERTRPLPPAPPDERLGAGDWFMAGTNVPAASVESHVAHFGLRETVDTFQNMNIDENAVVAAGLWGRWFAATHPVPDVGPLPGPDPDANPDAPPDPNEYPPPGPPGPYDWPYSDPNAWPYVDWDVQHDGRGPAARPRPLRYEPPAPPGGE